MPVTYSCPFLLQVVSSLCNWIFLEFAICLAHSCKNGSEEVSFGKCGSCENAPNSSPTTRSLRDPGAWGCRAVKSITFQPIRTAAGILKPAHPQEPLWTVDSGSGVPQPVVSLAHFHPALLPFLLLSVLGLPHSLSDHSSSPHRLPVRFLSHRCFPT